MPRLREKDLAECSFISDIDDLLADAWGSFIPRLNERFGTSVTPEEVARYGYVQDCPYWKGVEAERLLKELRSSRDFNLYLPVIEGALEGFMGVVEVAVLELYLTTRPQKIYAETVQWLEAHGFPEAPVVCRPHGISFDQRNRWKSRVIESSDIYFVLEDDIGLAEMITKNAIVLERPFNRNLQPKGVHVRKVAHWRDIPEEVALLRENWLSQRL